MSDTFNDYEYNMIKKFTFMCYSKKCNVVDRIKMRNKTSLWHDLLAYLQSSDSVLNAHNVDYTNGENNNCETTEPIVNYVVRMVFFFFYSNKNLFRWKLLPNDFCS